MGMQVDTSTTTSWITLQYPPATTEMKQVGVECLKRQNRTLGHLRVRSHQWQRGINRNTDVTHIGSSGRITICRNRMTILSK